MTPLLLTRRPARAQFRRPRRQKPSGLTVVHSAENMLDLIGQDTGAEGVASFIVGRDTPGSYHDLVDADSELQLVPYDAEAYQDGTGSNPHALSLSFALRASDWPRMSDAKVEAFLRNGARAFARQQAWLRSVGRPTTPLRRVTRAQSVEGIAGFITHGERDPGRRSDPGPLPWDLFLEMCRQEVTGQGVTAGLRPPPVPQVAGVPAYPGATREGQRNSSVTRAYQQRLRDRGWTIAVDGDHGPGTTRVLRQFQGEKHLGVDGIGGPATWAALWTAQVTR